MDTNSQIEKMQRLIDYGADSNIKSTNYNTPILEYKEKGADGRTYAVARIGNKFHIMEAPKKDTEILAEDFDYIGGFANRKRHEYSSYNKAYKNLSLKLKSIRESLRVKPQSRPRQEAEWQEEKTIEMREDINRFQEILNNSQGIMHESKTDFTQSHTLPEAPASNPSEKEVNSPFTDTATANGDKDFNKKATDPTKEGAPFENNPDKAVSGKDTFSEKPKYGPENNVAAQHPSGGKVTRADEGKERKFNHVVKLSKAQVLAWNRKNDDYMDTSKGTEIGNGAPFDQKPVANVNEGEVVHNTDNQNSPKPGNGEIGDGAPFDNKPNNVNEAEIDVNDVAGLPSEPDGELPFGDIPMDGAPTPEDAEFDAQYDSWLNNDGDGEMLSDDEISFSDFPTNAEPEMPAENPDGFPMESRNRNGGRINETELNSFGQHPAFRKPPMTLPPNTDSAPNGAKDWNDKSTKGDQPFGQKIGSGAPFDDFIDLITDEVMKHFTTEA